MSLKSVSTLSIICSLLFSLSCTSEREKTLFSELSSDQTSVNFNNSLVEEEGFDVFRYRNYYNGGGVGIGDINNDGLSDIYFISNQGTNRLYLNKGNFRFEDITESSNAGGDKPWATGVNFVDINNDGWLDIYVSNSGDPKGTDRANELFINNQDETFTEKASEYGLDDNSFTTHAAFFDFDQDGDLDCYLLNNSFRSVSSLPLKNNRDQRDRYGGDKLLENRDGKFVDISEEAGIFGNVAAFGLAITLMDANDDGWTDIYISNDFFERDYLYINQQGEGFSEELESYFDQISLASMGADAGDINNDGLPELFVTEMLPNSSERMKQMTTFESVDLFNFKDRQGFYKQFQRNTLQLNNGVKPFSEIGRYAGVDATDWSWGALIFDMNNSGVKELFVTNGVYKDVTDQDFLEYFGSEENLKAAREGSEVDFNKFVDRMPSTPLTNYAFEMDSSLIYHNRAEDWGFGKPSFSNGLAYGDLDNDGDPDLVINNLNQESFIYRNNSDEMTDNHYLAIKLVGPEKNKFAIGANITAYVGDKKINRMNYPSRGFQSSVDYKHIIGLGEAVEIDSLDIRWSARQYSRYYNLPVDTLLTFSIEDARERDIPSNQNGKIFSQIDFEGTHIENAYNDFEKEKLMFHQLSREGPPIAASDVNNDGLDDFYLGGAAGTPGKIFINRGNDNFERLEAPVFNEDASSEDVDAVFFDADGDGDQDLYVVSGGNEYPDNLRRYADRLYINTGKGKEGTAFEKSSNLPRLYDSGSVVKAGDYDSDGDIDLFVGNRSIPGEYGKPASSTLLENDGNGSFKDVTSTYISRLQEVGMVTDASWTDYDSDGDLDLVVVGEWMPIVLFENRGNFFQRQFNIEGLEQSNGWWRSIYPYDINHDGNMDFVVGNLGTNSMFKATKENPVRLFINDYDRNNSLDHIYTFKKEGEFIPYHLRDDLADQMSMIQSKFPDYESYADKSMNEIFTDEQMTNSIQLTAYNFHSSIIINKGGGEFQLQELPPYAQFAPINVIEIDDFNNDGKDELFLAGNFTGTKPQEGHYDANHGLFYTINGDGSLTRIPYKNTGMMIRGVVNGTDLLQTENGKLLVIGKNDSDTEIYLYN